MALPFPARGLAVAAAGLLCLLPAVASAQDEAVQRYLTAASRLYENLEYERALEQLKRAGELPGRTVDDDVAIALYEGIILADLGKKEESIAAFKQALFLKPDARLPVKVSPKVESDFEAVRAEVKKELAPILARQEAERKRKEDEARRAAEAARLAAEQRARDEAEARRLAEEAKAREAAERERQRTDRPERDRVISARPDVELSEPPLPEAPRKVERGLPVAPFVFGGVSLAAAGAGAYFGLQSRGHVQSARDARFQDQTMASLRSAESSALYANVAFGAAGAAAVATIVSLIVAGGEEPAARPAPLGPGDEGR